jgi:hypothetical protein
LRGELVRWVNAGALVAMLLAAAVAVAAYPIPGVAARSSFC